MRLPRWAATVVTAALLAIAIVGVQLLPWPPMDFKPFVMTIEAWNSGRVGRPDGTSIAGTSTYRLTYATRKDWNMTLIADDISADQVGESWVCDKGDFFTFDPRGRMTTQAANSENCNGVARWIHYGIAQWCPWQRTLEDGRATCTDGAELITVDLATGLPELYEAGLTRGVVAERMVFKLERYGR